MKRAIVVLAILLVVGAAAVGGWWFVNLVDPEASAGYPKPVILSERVRE